MIRLIASDVTIDCAAGGAGRREITGIAVPYGVAATVADGTSVIFEQGSMPTDGKNPRLYMNHDSTNAIGIVTERVDTPEGMMFTAKVSKTQAGDEALVLAMDGVLDSVSVGVNPTKFTTAKDGTVTVTAADWIELSMVPVPAFAGAIITDIAASIHQTQPEICTIETEPEQENRNMSDMTPAVEATIPTAPLFAQPKRVFAMPSAGEYLAALHQGGEVFEKVRNAFVEAQRSKQTAIEAAAGDILTTDTPGLLPVPVLGPVFQDLNFVRPVVNALGARSMPSTPSKTFIRPTITTHTSAASQTEGAAVSATTMVIASNVVTKSTVAGQVTLTQQDMDFTDPASMSIVLRDLAGEYMIATDNIAADAMVAGATASGSTWTVNQTNPASLITALYDASREIAEDSNFFPTHAFISPDVWEKLGRQLDASSRPVFAYTANGLLGTDTIGSVTGVQYNAMQLLGLNVVVDNNFAANTMLVVYAPGFEIYEAQQGILSVPVPATLSRTFSYYGYFATFVAKSSFIQSIAIA